MGETLYTVFNLSVLPFWALMIFAPGWSVTQRIIRTPVVPLLYAVLYVGLLVTSTMSDAPGDLGSLANLRLAFESDAPLLLAWVHYLCFDMVVGMWEVREAQAHGISALWLGPCLLATLALGPLGFLLFLGVRWFKTKRLAW